MARRVWQPVVLLGLLATSILAQTTGNPVTCGGGKQCPEDSPCCSQYGSCGVGAYCLGGCDPANSFSLEACVPMPVCQSKTFDWNNLDAVVPNTKYLGDSSEADWVSSGEPLQVDGTLLLTMREGTVGTLLASTTYMWYGKTSARLKTSGGAGVVTAFILLGDSKDEIDFEFIGVELESAQTNFYSLGVTNYENGGKTSGLSNTNENYHDYEIDWTPDKITWSIDGEVVRTLDREETWNATANRYSYPQTPCRVQLSLWPGGLPTNGEGTIEWAGGLVVWDSPYIVNNYYYAQFDKVTMECYDPPSGANVNGDKSYKFTDISMTNQTVEITDDFVVLASLLATGLNTTVGLTEDNSTAETIPGLSGAGPGTNGQRADNGTSSSGTDSPSTDTATATGSASTGFVQGDGGMDSGAIGKGEEVVRGSLLAVVIALVGLCVL